MIVVALKAILDLRSNLLLKLYKFLWCELLRSALLKFAFMLVYLIFNAAVHLFLLQLLVALFDVLGNFRKVNWSVFALTCFLEFF